MNFIAPDQLRQRKSEIQQDIATFIGRENIEKRIDDFIVGQPDGDDEPGPRDSPSSTATILP